MAQLDRSEVDVFLFMGDGETTQGEADDGEEYENCSDDWLKVSLAGAAFRLGMSDEMRKWALRLWWRAKKQEAHLGTVGFVSLLLKRLRPGREAQA